MRLPNDSCSQYRTRATPYGFIRVARFHSGFHRPKLLRVNEIEAALVFVARAFIRGKFERHSEV
jgi:hypothetical protein